MSTEPAWLDEHEMAAWLRIVAITELLPGVLDGQLRHDSQLNHFEYQVMAMLSQAPERTLRMSELAQMTSATLTRLSHAVKRIESRGQVRREPCPDDARATNAVLTEAGWQAVVEAAPGHVSTVRERVFADLTGDQVAQLVEITDAILARLDPEGAMTALYRTDHG